MIKVSIIVVLALGILAAIIAREFLVIEHTKTVAGQVVSNSKNYIQTPESPSASVLFLGDSLAAGVGAESSEVSVAGYFGTEHPTIQIQNLGVSGDAIKDTIAIVKEKVLEKHDTVVLQIGANDVFQFTPPKIVAFQIRELLRLLKDKSNRVIFMTYGDVGLAPGMPPIAGWVLHIRSMELRKIFIEEARKAGVQYIDLYEGPGQDLFGSDPDKYYAADLVHPKGEGYKIWYKKLQGVY